MLADRVARYLLERGRVTPAQVEEARRTRSFFGGQLASHLLRLGYVAEETLGEALTEIHGVPYASGEHLRVVAPEVLACVPAEIAGRLGAIPFRIEERRLRVAMLNPRDGRAVAELRAAAGRQIEPWITTEYRLYQALERHYRIAREGTRSISLAPERPPSEVLRPPALEGPPSPAPRTEAEMGLDGRPIDDDIGFDEEAYRPRPASSELEEGAAAGPPPAGIGPAAAALESASDEGAGESGGNEPPSDPLERLVRGLAGAASRDELAAALLDFCSSRARRCALFAVGRDGVRGLAGRGAGLETERLRKIVLPVETATPFDAALRSRDFFFGVVPPLPATRDLYTILGGILPAMALVLPIAVKERTVALLYLDDEDRPMTRPDIALMRRVTAKAGLAFEILLLRNKLREI